MIIALKHPLHGFHYAYSEGDAKVCEAGGWTRVPCDQHGNMLDDSPAVATEQPAPKRGRPRKEELI